MSTAVADEIIQDFANNANIYSNVSSGDTGTPGDERLLVKFSSDSHLDEVASRGANRPVYVMADYIKIMIPGDKDSIIHRPVREADKIRFAAQWTRYQAGQSQVIGSPLSEWRQITRAQVDELAFFNIRTIEDLANVSDSQKHKFMGINELCQKAKAYLALLEEQKPIDTLNAALASRDEQIATLQAQMAELIKAQTADKTAKATK